MQPLIWLGILALLLVVEAITAGLTTIWFAGGALVAAIACYAGANLTVQILLFLCVSLVLLIFTRPLAMKYFNKETIQTNANSLIGKKAVVIQEIDNLAQTGQVRINDIEWTARSADDEKIGEGTVVTIEEIRGVKLIVKQNKEISYGRGFLSIIVIAVWVLASCVRIVPQAYAVILERLGSLSGNLEYRNSLQGSVY